MSRFNQILDAIVVASYRASWAERLNKTLEKARARLDSGELNDNGYVCANRVWDELWQGIEAVERDLVEDTPRSEQRTFLDWRRVAQEHETSFWEDLDKEC